jgi:hypothetical protein
MNFEMVKSEIVKDGDGSGRAITRPLAKVLQVEIHTHTHTYG